MPPTSPVEVTAVEIRAVARAHKATCVAAGIAGAVLPPANHNVVVRAVAAGVKLPKRKSPP
jgi:hypothetical protein